MNVRCKSKNFEWELFFIKSFLITWMLWCSFFIVIFRHFIICQESGNIHVLEHHLKYILSNALWCWYWQFYVENIQTEYYHHFGVFNFSTLNFVLDENPIFCGCRFDGPRVKNWQNYIAVILALSWTLNSGYICFNW